MITLRPTIFLDIDGVLNTPHTPGFQTAAGKIEPALVSNLNLVADAFAGGGINIVISSHWRVWHSLSSISHMLYLAGLSNKAFIISKTPDDYNHVVDDYDGDPMSRPTPFIVKAKTRGDEIRDWLLDHPDVNAYGRWAIVDDNDWMNKNQHHRFVKTDSQEGLTSSKAYQLITILMTRA
jgi:hypothetical protein